MATTNDDHGFPIPSATILLVRDTSDGLEVFLLAFIPLLAVLMARGIGLQR